MSNSIKVTLLNNDEHIELCSLMAESVLDEYPLARVVLERVAATHNTSPFPALVREYFAALDSWAEHPTDDAHTRLHAADIELRREAGCDAVHVMKVAER